MVTAPPLHAQQSTPPGMTVGSDDLGGIVRGPNGPEAGVWVIAETTDLPTKFAKIVVTDDQGRYLLPELPKANYSVWVRGYGLVDSPKVQSAPGKILNLSAVPAPNAAAAAEYYPAQYWYSMLQIPDKSLFPGTGPSGNGMPANVKSQAQWLSTMKTHACNSCHQLGNKPTRTISKALGEFNSSYEAWMHRVQVGPAAEVMVRDLGELDTPRALRNFADWTDRVAKGELPKAKPQRPQGVERNVVVTSWEWGSEKTFIHDLVSSDRRNPTVNPYGPLFGSAEYSSDDIPILDPKTHKTSFFTMTTLPNTPESFGSPFHASAAAKPTMPSAYWGDEKIWSQRGNNHNGMFDKQGRVWFAAAVRGNDNPAFCKQGSDQPSAKVFPLAQSGRQAAMLDPKTMKYTMIDTCFGTHHPQFGYDADNTLWLSGTGVVAGWVNTKVWDETGDAAKAQGWAPFVLDTNGNGKIDEWTEPGQPAEAGKDTRIAGSGPYAVMPHPTDGSVWYTLNIFVGTPGFLRFDPKTKLTEFYAIPT